MEDSEIIMVKTIVSVLAKCMLYTGHAYPLVNEQIFAVHCTIQPRALHASSPVAIAVTGHGI